MKWSAPLLLLAACSLETPARVPYPLTVRTASVPPALPGPLRATVLFRTLTTTLAVADGPIADLGQVTLALEREPDAMTVRAAQLVVNLLESPALVVFSPQVVVYADGDGDGALALSPPGGRRDRVLAASQGELGWIPALDVQLGRLPLLQQQGYYLATEGRYTPWVRLGFARLSPGPAVAPPRPILLRLDDAVTASAAVACWDRGLTRQASPLARALHVRVDISLDAAALCPLDADTCAGEDLPSRAAPAEAPAGVTRRAQCRARGQLSALLLEDVRRACVDCTCGDAVELQLFLTRTASVVPWWPCGQTVELCPADGPLDSIVEDCP